MFERFTDEARRIIVLSQEAARQLNHDYIGTEHVLLGIMRELDGQGAAALRYCGIGPDRLDEVLTRIELLHGRGASPSPGHLPFTPRVKRLLELALREAIELHDTYISTEHLLLGLATQSDGVGMAVLADMGVTAEQLRSAVSGNAAFRAWFNGGKPKEPAPQAVLDFVARLPGSA